MRKIIALAIAIMMLAALAVPAFAATIDQDSAQKTGSSVITYTVEDTYTVTIPADLIATTNFSAAQTVSVADAVITIGKTLKVSMTGANSTQENDWLLKATEDNSITLAYTIVDKTTEGTEIESGSNILTLASGAGKIASEEYFVKVTGDATQAGTYTDTLNFAVVVE